ncbi:hypothetical protein P8452_09313 [Trifolium repens]|nr:hypothetical protein P8452_09313 [Trifolium repens]
MSDKGEPHRQIVLGINAPGIVEFKASGSKPPIIEIDTGAHFQTTMASENRDELIEWARKIAVKLNFGIIIGKSDFGSDRRKPYFKDQALVNAVPQVFPTSASMGFEVIDKMLVLQFTEVQTQFSQKWHAIQERLRRSDVSVKNNIRNQLRLIAFPETTNLQAPMEDAKSKGAKKKKRVRGTTREKSRFEHVDKRVADSQSSQSKPSSSQKKSSSSQAKPPVSTKVVVGSLVPMPISYAPQNPLFEHMPKFMRPYIEDVEDVSGDGYCGYRAISLFINGCEDDFACKTSHEEGVELA